jgi:hypothetical protein
MDFFIGDANGVLCFSFEENGHGFGPSILSHPYCALNFKAAQNRPMIAHIS